VVAYLSYESWIQYVNTNYAVIKLVQILEEIVSHFLYLIKQLISLEHLMLCFSKASLVDLYLD